MRADPTGARGRPTWTGWAGDRNQRDRYAEPVTTVPGAEADAASLAAVGSGKRRRTVDWAGLAGRLVDGWARAPGLSRATGTGADLPAEARHPSDACASTGQPWGAELRARERAAKRAELGGLKKSERRGLTGSLWVWQCSLQEPESGPGKRD